MFFLPIAERELRVAARKRSTFRLRVVAACLGVLVGACILIFESLGGASSAQAGTALFNTITTLLFAGCISAGLFFTSDCISEEKREGTLGFLFLTDLRGYDVIVGKLLATSLRAAAGLLAMMPVLAITLLTGGISGARFWQACCSLILTLVCSLAAGTFVSTISFEASRAFTRTLLLLLIWAVFGPLMGALLSGTPAARWAEWLNRTSPAYVFSIANGQGVGDFVVGTLLVVAIAVTLFTGACGLVRKVKTPAAGASTSTRSRFQRRYGSPAWRRRLRAKYLDPNPVTWLGLRERWNALGAWMIAFGSAALLVVFVLTVKRGAFWIAWNYLSTLFFALIYFWMAFRSAQLFVEARRNGVMELLLSTPLSVGELIHGQSRALVRSFGPPLVIMAAVNGFAMTMAYSQTWRMMGAAVPFFMAPAAGILSAVLFGANVLAIGWLGMYLGLTSKTTNLAALRTLLFVQVIPWFLISFASGFVALLVTTTGVVKLGGAVGTGMGWAFPMISMAVSASLAISKDLLIILWARNRLRTRFRELSAWLPWADRRGATPVAPLIPAPPVIKR